ncbi:MAG: HU family DNA-binding protein [Paracoccaceae bacterium]|jgi:DNA-binding protein HU-alpha
MATTKKTSTASAAKTAAAPKAVPATAAAADSVDSSATDSVEARPPALKIRDLVSRVVEVSGAKRKDVKEIVEATLTVLGDALGRGEDFNLPGFGRTRIARTTEKDGASHLTLKVRRGPHRKKEPTEPLADEEDDS